MAEDPFTRLGIDADSSRAAIKKAYRKLCLACHPDLRSDKERATEEFRELTRIYQIALSMIGKVKPVPPPPPRRPDKPIIHTVRLTPIDSFEFTLFGEASRVALIPPALLEYGGSLKIFFHDEQNYGVIEGGFEFIVPPKTTNGQKFRFQLAVGQVEITLVREGK